MYKYFIVFIIAVGIIGFYYFNTTKTIKNNVVDQSIAKNLHPLSLEAMRQKSYPGSEVTIEQTLPNEPNYKQYIASYRSEGLKIYALLTIPIGENPIGGWPVIVFNHGYIPPVQYRTNERYIAYIDAFASNGYIVFKPDYRGNGQSEGNPEGAYYSPAYATDVMNAVSSIKNYSAANPLRIGMWGHSLGGNIALRSLEISSDIKAAVIWAGVVGSYDDLMNNWRRRTPFRLSEQELARRSSSRQKMVAQYGTPKDNPLFWNSIDPNYNIRFIGVPVQLHHGEEDQEVPLAFSQSLHEKLKSAKKAVEFYTYPGTDHNISGPSFDVAMKRTVEFFDKYLK